MPTVYGFFFYYWVLLPFISSGSLFLELYFISSGSLFFGTVFFFCSAHILLELYFFSLIWQNCIFLMIICFFSLIWHILLELLTCKNERNIFFHLEEYVFFHHLELYIFHFIWFCSSLICSFLFRLAFEFRWDERLNGLIQKLFQFFFKYI